MIKKIKKIDNRKKNKNKQKNKNNNNSIKKKRKKEKSNNIKNYYNNNNKYVSLKLPFYKVFKGDVCYKVEYAVKAVNSLTRCCYSVLKLYLLEIYAECQEQGYENFKNSFLYTKGIKNLITTIIKILQNKSKNTDNKEEGNYFKLNFILIILEKILTIITKLQIDLSNFNYVGMYGIVTKYIVTMTTSVTGLWQIYVKRMRKFVKLHNPNNDDMDSSQYNKIINKIIKTIYSKCKINERNNNNNNTKINDDNSDDDNRNTLEEEEAIDQEDNNDVNEEDNFQEDDKKEIILSENHHQFIETYWDVLVPHEVEVSVPYDVKVNTMKYIPYFIYVSLQLQKNDENDKLYDICPQQGFGKKCINIGTEDIVGYFIDKNVSELDESYFFNENEIKNKKTIKEKLMQSKNMLWCKFFNVNYKINNYSFDFNINTNGNICVLRFIANNEIEKQNITKLKKANATREYYYRKKYEIEDNINIDIETINNFYKKEFNVNMKSDISINFIKSNSENDFIELDNEQNCTYYYYNKNKILIKEEVTIISRTTDNYQFKVQNKNKYILFIVYIICLEKFILWILVI